MELKLDDRVITPKPGQSIVQMLRELDMDDTRLSRRPLAAKIAGEVFTLNYIPLRDAAGEGAERNAISAAGEQIRLLRFADNEARYVYERSALFVFFLAVRSLWPDAVAEMNFTVGDSMNITISKEPALSADDMKALRAKIADIIREDFPLVRSRVKMADAIDFFFEDKQPDKARLLSWQTNEYFDCYRYGDYLDYFYGEMLPSTGYLTVWDLYYGGGNSLFFLFPDNGDPDRVSSYKERPNFTAMFQESEQWCRLMDCKVAADLNDWVINGRIRELIRVNEALHERSFSGIADTIIQRGAKAVLLAGPSSSGKTTSANRLAVQLSVHGKKPILMSLDDYYMDRDKIAPGPDGKLDLEHINTIDTDLFRQQLGELLQGEEVELPSFDFLTKKRVWKGKKLRLNPDSVVIIEGLHALNPLLLREDFDHNLIFRMFVSPLQPLNMDNHNRIPTAYMRLLRRIVRDHETRGASVEETISMWASVRAGEERWIFPFQENADVIFNSSFIYELAILKTHIYPILQAVPPENPCYDQVKGIRTFLDYICQAEVDDEVPPTSILREFIGGNSFYR